MHKNNEKYFNTILENKLVFESELYINCNGHLVAWQFGLGKHKFS